MFLNNRYTKIYYAIIAKARSEQRVKYRGIYFEGHHEIPKKLGGGEDQNLVLLTAREHYLCHRLLVKMLPPGKERGKMAYAFYRFNNIKYTSAKAFERAKIAAVAATTGAGNAFFGKKHKAETLERISGENHGMYGKTLVGVWTAKYGVEEANRRMAAKSEKMRKAITGKKLKPHTEEWKKNHSAKISGENHQFYGISRKRISLNGERKFAMPDEVQKFLEIGWKLGW
jgi:hypothetical protein